MSVAALFLFVAGASGADPLSQDQLAFFEKKIRPLLIEHCYECHDSSQGKIKGGLSLTSRKSIENGGDTGAVIHPGSPDTSLLIKAVRYQDRDLQMPPRTPLPPESVQDLETWIAMGAPDPREEPVNPNLISSGMSPEEGREFWSFRPRKEVPIPSLSAELTAPNPVDAFILATLEAKGLSPAPPADPGTWLRRITFDLTGLPPTPEELEAFNNDNSPTARSQVIDRLLASRDYGVRWGRHWLDVARYADSNGLDENLTFGNAWRYRDYVVRSFNEDKAFDRFLIEQIAGDLLQDRSEETLVATGFLALGARVLAEPDREKLEMDVVDEQLDTVGKAFLGLTLGCARCHDHKFDPILQTDYYSLAAIFRSTNNFSDTKTGAIHHWYENDFSSPDEAEALEEWDKKIKAAKKSAESFKSKAVSAIQGIARSRAVDYLAAATRFETETSLDEVAGIAAESALHPRILYHTRLHLEVNQDKTVFQAWWKYHRNGDVDGLRTFYDNKFENAVLRFNDLKAKDPKVTGLPDADLELYRAELFNRSGFLTVPDKADHSLSEEELKEYNRLEEEARILESEAPDHPSAMGVTDSSVIRQRFPVHIRGSHLNLGENVPRAFPAVFSETGTTFPENASGRLELARWMADPDHPLTARVIVNRIWRWHFGRGLVDSTENFGAIGERPSHPDLLDWLANWFVAEGWSIKKLNRLILLSETYGSSSSPDGMDSALIDPDNRLLSSYPVRRLDAEEIRDSILAVAGRLDREIGGKTIPLRNRQMVFNHTSKDHTTYSSVRRTAYLPVVRNNLHDWLQLFDFPDPTMPTGNRVSTTIAPQALLMMNAPLVNDSAAAFAGRLLAHEGTDEDRIRLGWLLAFGREPTRDDVAMSNSFLLSLPDPNLRWTLFCHSLFASNHFIYLN